MRVVERALEASELTDDDIFVEAATKGTDLYNAVEVLLKGPELSLEQYGLPAFLDKGGDPRRHARIRWWNSEERTVSELAEIPPGSQQENGDAYPAVGDVWCDETILSFEYGGTKPVLFGHYWRNWAHSPTTNTWRTPKTRIGHPLARLFIDRSSPSCLIIGTSATSDPALDIARLDD